MLLLYVYILIGLIKTVFKRSIKPFFPFSFLSLKLLVSKNTYCGMISTETCLNHEV